MKSTEVGERMFCPAADSTHTGLEPVTIAQGFIENLWCLQARFSRVATRNDNYMALAHTVRDRMLHRWISSAQTYLEHESRTVCYLSAEFLLGPQLACNILNLGIERQVRLAMEHLGLDVDELVDQEAEPGLGNGGLGRLAACYLESMATLGIPSLGYGIRYEFGIFEQFIRDGWQVESTDKWLRLGNPWEIPRPEILFDVKFGGRTETYTEGGEIRVRWVPDRVVRGMAYDTPVLGYRRNNVNLLRLWKAEAVHSFDFEAFNVGDYYRAVMEKVVSENITKVLYPNDESPQGKQLRLQQQYFFAACSIQDMLRLFFQRNRNLDDFDAKFAIQINDTHPAIAVVELMRVLVDEHHLSWDRAWDVTQNSFGYTNHTLLPEALEKWPVSLFEQLLPRHLQIIYEINRRFLNAVRARYPGDEERVRRLSLIDESGERFVRMAHLASVGSHSINGVARLHTQLLGQEVLRDFYEVTPEKFKNVTNGVTPRRFIAVSNPRLGALLTETLGEEWPVRLELLGELEPKIEDRAFREKWREVKRANKLALADWIRKTTGVEVLADSIFDVQVKRIHEYKRQVLNVLHIVWLYTRLQHDPGFVKVPRTFVFGGKAAPGYRAAKLIIKLINSIGRRLNADPDTNRLLRVVFVPNFNVKTGQRLYPAADLSEQISTAGQEASGTGNMKMTLNGALTIGSLDGANIEIREKVGTENFFLFGLTAREIRDLRASGYRPRDLCERNPELMEVLGVIRSGTFNLEDPHLFQGFVDGLMEQDPFMVLADFASYVKCQQRVSEVYADPDRWTRMSILNVARSAYFSSDRAIREYAVRIWRVEPVQVGPPADAARRVAPYCRMVQRA